MGLTAMKRPDTASVVPPSDPKRSNHPQLDALRASLAAMPPEQRQKILAAFSELVRKRLELPGDQS